MKAILILISLPFFFIQCYCQISNANEKAYMEIEKWLPLYFIENYCLPNGLQKTLKSASADARITTMQKKEFRDLADYMWYIRYNNVLIQLAERNGDNSLYFFKIEFNSKNDLEQFISNYISVMNFSQDPDDKNRYFYEGGSTMDALYRLTDQLAVNCFATYRDKYCNDLYSGLFDSGFAKFNQGNYAGVIKDFSLLIGINPQISFTIYAYRGLAKQELNDYNGANQDFLKAVEGNPTNALDYYARGWANYYLKNQEKACLDWNNAKKLGSSNAITVLKEFCK